MKENLFTSLEEKGKNMKKSEIIVVITVVIIIAVAIWLDKTIFDAIANSGMPKYLKWILLK